MNDELVGGKIGREFAARSECDIHIRAGELFDPRRQLDRTDVAALTVMRTALGDQHTVAIREGRQCRSTAYLLKQITFIPRKKD